MELKLSKLNIAPPYFLRQAGYAKIRNPHKNEEISYARSLEPSRFYPRFHIYLKTGGQETEINLHLDAKKPSYEGTTAHSGEYEGKTVEAEAERIKRISEKFLSKITERPIGFSKKKAWWQRLLG